MTRNQLPVATDVDAELEKIARRYKGAGGVGINVLNLIGGQAENLLERLPAKVRTQLEAATVRALNHAMTAAHKSRGRVPASRLSTGSTPSSNLYVLIVCRCSRLRGRWRRMMDRTWPS